MNESQGMTNIVPSDSYKIELRGMRFRGKHGVDHHERVSLQPFIVDVEVEGAFAEAVEEDNIAKTLDYRDIHRICRSVLEDQSYQLLETVAHSIASRILLLPRVLSVLVHVKKTQLALGDPVDYEAATVKLFLRGSSLLSVRLLEQRVLGPEEQ